MNQNDGHKRKTDDKIDQMYDFLIGSNEFPGLLTRVDRLEQLEEARKMHRGILYAATGGLIAERLWDWIKGK